MEEINRYRGATGLAPVSDQPAWDLGIQHHLNYLDKTPEKYFTGEYQSMHTENPASPYYTSDGALEAGYSDLGGGSSALDAVDGWLESPFHAIGMLRAQLSQVAIAFDSSSGRAGLDVIQGLDRGLPPATAPILFPGQGVTTDLFTFAGGESPNPLETCGWQELSQVGLPLIVLLPQPPDPDLGATLSGPNGIESTANGKLCIVDESTYHSSDSVYGPTGAAILETDSAVILIPRAPLARGSYQATVQQPGQSDVSWSFETSAGSTSAAPAPRRCVVPKLHGLKLARARKSLTAAHCRVGKITRKHSMKVKEGSVISTKPPAGSHRKNKTRIALVVSLG